MAVMQIQECFKRIERTSRITVPPQEACNGDACAILSTEILRLMGGQSEPRVQRFQWLSGKNTLPVSKYFKVPSNKPGMLSLRALQKTVREVTSQQGTYERLSKLVRKTKLRKEA